MHQWCVLRELNSLILCSGNRYWDIGIASLATREENLFIPIIPIIPWNIHSYWKKFSFVWDLLLQVSINLKGNHWKLWVLMCEIHVLHTHTAVCWLCKSTKEKQTICVSPKWKDNQYYDVRRHCKPCIVRFLLILNNKID